MTSDSSPSPNNSIPIEERRRIRGDLVRKAILV